MIKVPSLLECASPFSSLKPFFFGGCHSEKRAWRLNSYQWCMQVVSIAAACLQWRSSCSLMLLKWCRARDLCQVAEHVCARGCYLFPRVHEKDWQGRAADTCPVCHGRRFHQEHLSDGRVRLKSVKVGCWTGLSKGCCDD